MPSGTQTILNARSLDEDYRRLAALLKPGLRVLDVGCGTGAITRGMAGAVGSSGYAVGVDINARFAPEAGAASAGVAALAFARADTYRLPFPACFDVVTTARTLQWLKKPSDALAQMASVARPGGFVVALDFNHEKATWTPQPPSSMAEFYDGFLRWRAEAGMDNAMADHLAELFRRTGLAEIEVSVEDEFTERGAPDFERRAGIWAEVAATRGHQLVADGVISESLRAAAEGDYRIWVAEKCERQTSYLRCAVGVKPA